MAMAKKNRLILHIGSHKTGTTSIQGWLHDKRHDLESHGVSFVTAPPEAHLHRVLGFVDPSSLVPGGMHVIDPDGLAESFANAACATVVASSENFSFFFEKRSIEALRDITETHFEQVVIVTYLRRQESHAVSHHQEGAKPLRRAEEQLFGFAPTALPDMSPDLDLYLDYEQRIGMWIDVFGRENVIVRPFDRARMAGGDVQQDFAEIAKLDGVGLEQRDDLNTSLGLSGATVGHMMNARPLSSPLKARILARLPDDPPLLPSQAEACAFYARYKQGNIRLNARLGNTAGEDFFSDDFSWYPEVADASWPRETALEVIGTLLDQLAAYDDLVDADTMRDAALLAHKAGNGGKALRLMTMAATLRPEGEFIQRKRAEFEALYGSADAKGPV